MKTEICNSHIIPEWAYEGVYDEKHRFDRHNVLNGTTRRFEQKGAREKILCRACESKLSVWEGYGKSVWERKKGSWRELPGGGLFATNLDYAKLKLFLLSLLWRTDVASGHIGENVCLGPHSEKIRSMLQEDDPKDSMLYPCMMMRIIEGNSWQKAGLRWPIRGRWDGQRAYTMAFKGIGLLYIVGNHRLSKEQERGCVDTTGRIVMGQSSFEGWTGGMEKMEIMWPSEDTIRGFCNSEM